MESTSIVSFFEEVVSVLAEMDREERDCLMHEKKNEIVGWWRGTFEGKPVTLPKEKYYGYAIWIIGSVGLFEGDGFIVFIKEICKEYAQNDAFFREWLPVLFLTFGSVLNTMASHGFRDGLLFKQLLIIFVSVEFHE